MMRCFTTGYGFGTILDAKNGQIFVKFDDEAWPRWIPFSCEILLAAVLL